VGYTVYVSESLTTGDWVVFERGGAVSGTEPVEVFVPVSLERAARFLRVSVP
jgi:hypothetical protein